MTTMTKIIPEYLQYREQRKGRAPNTLKVDRATCHALLIAFGDIKPANISERHVDAFVALVSQGGVSKYNQRVAGFRSFIEFCRLRGYVPRTCAIGADLDYMKKVEAERHRVPVTKFGQLLDACETPRDRVLVALGLYLFLRGGEITSLRVRDVNLDTGEIVTTIHKTKDSDVMPISAELDAELRRWLEEYAAQCGPLQPDWYLVPRRYGLKAEQPRDDKGAFVKGDSGAVALTLLPDKPLTNPHLYVQKALAKIGFATQQREGVHTLRRSGARALFDALVDAGYDGALKQVQAMLHHKNGNMTERYLGLQADRHRRDRTIKGQYMFGAPTNVVQLRQAR